MTAHAQITEHRFTSAAHTTFYLSAGPTDGPLVLFLHGWPELSLSWRHVLPVIGGLGYRCVAPDMRGYGGSSTYPNHADYALEPNVQDMLNLLLHLGADRAVWVGHDWGSPVAWSLASHHPEHVVAVASLCVPYRTLELGLDHVIALSNREIYPEREFPAAQWEYMRYYEEAFDSATAAFDANPRTAIKALFRKGDPAAAGQPAATAFTRQLGGWFGTATEAPDVPLDTDVLTEADLDVYAEALGRNGFFGPDSSYMNHDRNSAYGQRAPNNGHLDLPVLFLAAAYDYVCDSVRSDLAAPMRAACSNLTEVMVPSGHWMAQEAPDEVNEALSGWLQRDDVRKRHV